MVADRATPLDPLAIPLTGVHLVEASAGTGKTHTITTLYLRLLLEGRRTVEEILVVTFTNAATAELRAKIRARLRAALAALDAPDALVDEDVRDWIVSRTAAGCGDEDRLRLVTALGNFDQAAIFTIHGFCQRMLHEHAFESGVLFDVELSADQSGLLAGLAQDFWVRALHAAPVEFVQYLRSEKRTVRTLEQLATLVVAHPDMPVLPAVAPAAQDDPAATVQAWLPVFTRAAEIWRTDRVTIVELLCAGELNGNVYRSASIRGAWSASLDAAFATGQPGIAKSLADFADKLTPATLEQRTKKRCTTPRHPFFDAWADLLAADEQATGAFDARWLQLQREFVDWARAEAPRRKERAGVQSFDDLLHRLAAALAGPGGEALAARIRARFSAALIDEFQDTDPVQYAIFHRVYGAADTSLAEGRESLLILVGDPKQAIYAFRGADVFAYIRAKRRLHGRVLTLDTNWRSTPSLIRAVNTLFERLLHPFACADIPFRAGTAAPRVDSRLGVMTGEAPPFEVLFARRSDTKLISKQDAARELPPRVASEIVQLLTSGTAIGGRPVCPADVAVLCRTNRQAQQVQNALRARGVHSVLQSEASVFETPEAGEVLLVLHALEDPRNATAVRSALATALLGQTALDLAAMQDDEARWDRWLSRFRTWHDRWVGEGKFVVSFREMMASEGVDSRLLRFPDGERRLTNVLHLMELLHTACSVDRLGPSALVRWLAEMRSDAAARAERLGDTTQIRLESDEAAVKLVTIHKSKGLQYPIVYCPFLWDGTLLREADRVLLRFHDRAHDDRLTLHLDTAGREASEAQAALEALSEALRLLYVAVTRAQYRCSIVWGAFNEAESSPLGYVLHPPAEPAADADAAARAAREHLNALMLAGDAALEAELAAIAHAGGGTIHVTDLSPASDARYPAEPSAHGQLQSRPLLEDRPPRLRLQQTSFTSLTAGPEARTAEASGEGVDHDTAVAGPALPAAAGVGPTEPETPVPLADLPSGARVGELIHRVLERIDFQEHEAEVWRTTIAEQLRVAGGDAQWTERLRQALCDVVETPLPGVDPPLHLRDVSRTRRLTEMAFVFPVAHPMPAGAPLAGAVTPRTLAAVFARHASASGGMLNDYLPRLQRLGFAPFAGFLKGVIDLVFQHDGRWYLADYKSHLLGRLPGHYGIDRMRREMERGHYYLQYHLYVVALHRYLRCRLAEYAYERHFGGVYYLFLRGMRPQHPFGTGVFVDRPPVALVEDLSAVLAGTPTEAPWSSR